ncbi:MAG: hypothetical protein JWM59_2894 [Verrucomicrobiales bacterium]|nr:hypothetical protein [Verrucomicrobiales bacterium]RYD36395.1 MAG: hypothetical protein EOP86_06065 [Verrucomicrobiaceae bacterium]
MHDPTFRDTAFLVFRAFCGAGLIFTLIAGWYLHRNFDRLLGVKAELPSETRGARGYTRMLVVAIWMHMLVFFTMGVLLLH